MAIRNQKEYDFKKNEIINCSEELFFKNGFDNISMIDIAKESGFSRKTLYSYFKNKKDILFSVYLKGAKERIAFLKKINKTKKTGIERIYLIGDSYYKFFKKNPLYLKLQIYWYNFDFNEKDIEKEILKELSDNSEVAITLMKKSLELGINDGSIRKDINIGYTFNYFITTTQIVLNDSILPQTDSSRNYNGKKYYYEYLNLFIRSIKQI